jgi:hypothetical protein
MMCQYRFTDSDNCSTLVQDAGGGGKGTGEPKTALTNTFQVGIIHGPLSYLRFLTNPTSKYIHLTDLLENILFPHQLLPFSVGLGEDYFKHILARVSSTSDKVNQVLQQLRHRPCKERDH